MKLNQLTDKFLILKMSSLVQEEREILSQVLWHLREIDVRKLYSDLKYGSLYEYCVKELKYSEGQASRRVNAARLLREMPEMMEEIERGEINLTQLNQLSSFCLDEGIRRPEVKKKIINEIAGKTTRETEKILDKLRSDDSPRRRALMLKEETIAAIKGVHELKAHAFKDLDEVIIEMTKLAEREWDPGVVKRRRALGEGKSRYVQAQVRAEVWKRDGGKCVNCGSRRALELDHVKAFARGGETTVENLSLLCRNCNQRKGIVEFGKEISHYRRFK